MSDIKDKWVHIIHQLQNNICAALEEEDGKATFIEDDWVRQGGGGGKTRVIANGNVFEKGGVNTSVVHGNITDAMRKVLNLGAQQNSGGETWFAAGISIVLHPENPFVPTVHCNYRMFQLSGADGNVLDCWFGGGTDLTPYYLFEEDAIHFHGTYKNICDQFDTSFYASFKKTCDDYFVNTHRGQERRGIGGIFYDHQRPSSVQALSPEQTKDEDFWMNFGKACGDGFLTAYLPIVQKRKDIVFNDQHKYWQEIRRGRYVEFNLVHDRGTIFGLKTNGRTESILMSLPPTVRFDYNHQPTPGSEEDKLLQACLQPRDWFS